MRAIVRNDQIVNALAIRQLLPGTVGKDDVERFIELVRRECAALHGGNIVRFGLRPLEYAVWRDDAPARQQDEAPTGN